jgi:hypothetical protein
VFSDKMGGHAVDELPIYDVQCSREPCSVVKKYMVVFAYCVLSVMFVVCLRITLFKQLAH